MARKPTLSIEALTALGSERLARLVLDEAGQNAPFRKIVNAALAGTKGPEAVAKLIDRRLAALEKAKSFIDWDKAKTFRADLSATLTTIVDELGRAAPDMAIDRLLRFVATHAVVFERIDDSYGHVQAVYANAVEAVGHLAGEVDATAAETLPDRVDAALQASSQGYYGALAGAIIPHLAPARLRRWDSALLGKQKQRAARERASKSRYGMPMAAEILEIRQAIAEALDDLDGLVALEDQKPAQRQDSLDIAHRLLKAGRADEALAWVRREAPSSIRVVTAADIADGTPPRGLADTRQALLEATILEALDQKDEAQAVRWAAFEATLSVETLRAFVAALPDFEDFAALDRAFAYVLADKRIYLALEFFLEWPDLRHAARLVSERAAEWNGQHYQLLVPAADALEHDQPLAASVLYRALVDSILKRGHSVAYGHAAGCLAKLDELAESLDDGAFAAIGLPPHATYTEALKKQHGRKTAFWIAVRDSQGKGG